MVNTKILNRLCIAVFTVFLLSCSEDDSLSFDENADFSISHTDATQAGVRLNYDFSGSNAIAFGLRKKGEEKFNVVDRFGSISNIIKDLEPAQSYELTILVEGTSELFYKIEEFATLPFDFLENENSLTFTDYTYSEVGFEHIFEAEIFTGRELPSSDKFKLFLTEIGDDTNRIPLPFEFVQNKLQFQIPQREENDPKQNEILSYTLNYEIVDGGTVGAIPYAEQQAMVFRVHPNIPYFLSLEESRTWYEVDGYRCGDKSYVLVFKGNIFGNTTTDANFGVEEVTLKLTNTSNSKEILLTEGDLLETCNTFTRLISNNSNALNSLHWPNREVKLRFDRDIDLGIIEGDYTIQCIAKVNNEVIEGIPFPFTLEDNRSISGYTKQLRELFVDGIDKTDDLLDPCDLKETIKFKEDGTLENTSYVPNDTMECVVAEIKNGTWAEEPAEGDLKKYTLNIEAGLTQGDKQVTAYLGSHLTLYFEEEKTDDQGQTEVYRYIFR
ncbi:hypothetical protein U6A24_16645 [Aquimarina gracilis]|uniref:Uncharacterized protein n=1 Tax=Aquimarina gracilis TaxID=874422 RepID=A0ABU5ZYY2_9FLAO|nr:hypothetical protein [Aquimarina gracilis]MEB3347104.1 hypothetical protein [Aquimarina gracilis]